MGTLTAPASEGAVNLEERPRPVRVLVVDDSLFMRKLISGLLEEDAGITVAGQARDGLEALQRIAELDPDVVTLDVEMPRLDGLGVLERLMQVDPRPVVMVSGLTRENAEATVASLRLGAVDFLTKPSGSVSPDLPRLKKELQAKVKAAAHLGKGGVRRVMGYSPPPHPREAPPAPFSCPGRSVPPSRPETAASGPPAHEPTAAGSVAGGSTFTREGASRDVGPARRLVVVGASTGGPAALHFLVRRLAGLVRRLAPVAMLIVQHIPVGFSPAMARSLSEAARGAFTVEEASPRSLGAGDVLLAPGGYHLRVVEGPAVELSLDPPVAGVRPAVDVTLMSAARLFPRRLLALILTGMGSDGLRGAMAVRRAGGRVIAQDRETSVVYGMPRAVAEAGLADQVLPLESIPEAVAAWVGGALL
ncbi:MAG: chemotaxis-specific protein-glutamate methyltransferase CheB [Bacillota bacterium]|nr:chemotaxis-specific protein-glutamate methyltransferase CheB [Bacillota bacterium]MDI7249231.1 chemotaxis-specific protein-glutamate methyltransferase CheB [Bacillota bacterium]